MCTQFEPLLSLSILIYAKRIAFCHLSITDGILPTAAKDGCILFRERLYDAFNSHMVDDLISHSHLLKQTL